MLVMDVTTRHHGGVIYNYICHILLKYKGRGGRDHMVVWFTTTYVIYYWNTRGRRVRDHMLLWFTTTYVIYYLNTRGRRGRDHMVVGFTTTYVILYFSNPWHMQL
jgi:hypothetical protein